MNNKILAFLLMSLLAFMACEDEMEPEEMQPMVDPPTAGFTITSNENLTVVFNNTSTDGTSFSWAFGDGKTSTEENPTHTYANGGTYTVTLTATNSEGSNEASQSVTVTDPYKKSGFLLGSVVTSSAGTSYFGGYFDQVPNPDVDLTQSSSFQRFQFITQHKEFLYGYPTTNEAGLSKFAVDNETNEVVLIDEIPLFNFVFDVVIVDDETGFFTQGNSQELTIFNPTTMAITGSVDMSNAQSFPENDANSFGAMIYNEQTGKLYLSLFTNNFATAQFYDADATYVEVVDVASRSWEKTIVHNDATYTLFRGNTNTVIDEQGNTYLIAQGSYGLDNQVGPTAAKGSRPQIIKIDANSEFDTTFAFNPIDAVGLQNNFFQLFTSMVYAGNNKVYGLGTGGPESQEIVALLIKLGAGTITDAEFDQLVQLVLFNESFKVMEIDLATKAVSFVDGIPFTAGFSYPYMYNYNGKIYSQITANGATFNGFYEIDPTTNMGTPLFNVSAGGFAFQYIDLAAGL
ncbi:MAG: PKD domain-containing protein [Bacteroidota bacterium]